MARKSGIRLTREQIVSTALELLDEVGLDGLSTRAVAERIGVKQPALYWHFKNRQALLDAMNQGLLEAHNEREPLPGEPWTGFLQRSTASFRRALLSRRDGARIHAGTEADPSELALAERQIAVLVDAGFAPGEALDVLVAFSRYTVGCVLEEQATGQREEDSTLAEAAVPYPLTAIALEHYQTYGHDRMFDDGLAMLIDGARIKLDKAQADPKAKVAARRNK